MDGRTLAQIIEQQIAEERYREYVMANQPNWWQALLLMSPMLVGIFLITLIVCLSPFTDNAVAQGEDERDDGETIPINTDIENESLNEGLLKSVGVDENQVRDHRRLGFFYDFSTMNIPDEPVVLNTGDIVDEHTAEKLVRNRARLPRGEVVGFYRSHQLKGLLTTLVEDEIAVRLTNKR